MKAKTQSSRQTKTQIRESSGSSKKTDSSNKRGKKNQKKPDNTKLYIGIGGGVAFLFIIILIIANRPKEAPQQQQQQYTAQNEPEKTFIFPLEVKREIYAKYQKSVQVFEDESAAAINNLGKGSREGGSDIRAEVARKISQLKYDLTTEYKKRYPEASGDFITKIVNAGIDGKLK